MRNWIKAIIFECLKELVKDQPMIISNRAPNPDDVYQVGTIWKNGNDFYLAKRCSIEWEKQSEKKKVDGQQ